MHAKPVQGNIVANKTNIILLQHESGLVNVFPFAED